MSKSCPEPTEWQLLAESSEIDPARADALRRHLRDCHRCQDAYQAMVGSDRMNATVEVQRPPTSDSDSSPISRANRHNPTIEGYVIQGRLGQGGMGVVYRALQVKLNRVVALKVLPAVVADRDAISRFRREAMAAARLHHTNIVPIYDFGESQGSHFYAMELIEGQPLNVCIKSFAAGNVQSASAPRLADVLRTTTTGGVPIAPVEPMTWPGPDASGTSISSSSAGRGKAYFRQVALWMADAADALHYAHSQGIIHRDIKPGNMILSNDGRLMITDFGLAKTSDDTSISVVGTLIGAIRYISPEQAMAGHLNVDHRTDIWSLGATLYELLTLTPAFPDTDQNKILSAIITKEPISPRKLNAHIPEDLETICLKALEKDPDHRYATARAMGEDIRRYLDGFAIEAKRAGPLRRIQKYAKRNRAMSTAAISVLLIALLIGVIVTGRRELLARDAFTKGQLAENAGDWQRAIDYYRRADRLRPNRADYLFNIARAIQELYDRKPTTDGMAAEALTYCERARALDPKLRNIDNTYGVLLSMNGQPQRAIEIFKADLVGDNPAPHVWTNIAAVHYIDGKDQQALQFLQNAIDNPRIRRTNSDGVVEEKPYLHAYHELATLQLLHRNPEALKTIERGIDLKPQGDSHWGYHLVRARILLTLPEVRDDSGGVSAAETADGLFGELNPNPNIKRYLALGFLRTGKVERARNAIEVAKDTLGNMPTYTTLLLVLAEAKAGNLPAAQAALKEADETWPDDLRVPGAIRRSRHLGMIWFESNDELTRLRDEAAALLDRGE